jgi:hypothetical protein
MIRTQVYGFTLFVAIVLTSSLLHFQFRGDEPAAAQTPQRPADASLFYSAVSQHFQVGPQQVRALVDGGLPPEDVVVLYYIAQHSLRQPGQLLADRRAGRSWRDIAIAAGLQPESFYYPIANSRGPFVNVYALYHQVPRDRWSWDQLRLTDTDIGNLVNLRFLAELGERGEPDPHPTNDVQRLREQGFDYVSIHHFLLSGQQTAQRETGMAAAGQARS